MKAIGIPTVEIQIAIDRVATKVRAITDRPSTVTTTRITRETSGTIGMKIRMGGSELSQSSDKLVAQCAKCKDGSTRIIKFRIRLCW